eukprot:TRINITY_DN28229_c0_g2_i2.p1 TRINITY_DN28229_c0_g2~~TRINITY_DN28229_c0_g2_i2.p1  ORF type:complete len:449 (-),score=30.18 TRINITY_DN28229_c0_g2_i2:403-1581(-)
MMEALTKYFFKALCKVESEDAVSTILSQIHSGSSKLLRKCKNGMDQSKILIKLTEALAESYSEACQILIQETLKNSLADVIYPLFGQWCSMIADVQLQRELCISTLVDLERIIWQNTNTNIKKEVYFNLLEVIIKRVVDILQSFIYDQQYNKVIFCFGESQGLINAAQNFSSISLNKMEIAKTLKEQMYSIKRTAVCLQSLQRCQNILLNKEDISSAYQALDLLQEAGEMCQEGDELILAQIYATIAHVWWGRLHTVDPNALCAYTFIQKCQQQFENIDTLDYMQEHWYTQVQHDLQEIKIFQEQQRSSQEDSLDALLQNLQEKLDQGIQIFLHFIYDNIPQKKKLDENLSLEQQLKKARTHFHPDSIGQDLKSTYCEISKLINQQYQELQN